MTLEDLISITGERFFTQLLAEAYPSLIAAAEAAYFERVRVEENKIYEARALLLIGPNLHLFKMISEGHRHDDQQETIDAVVLPIDAVAHIETHLLRSGWARGNDARSMEDREFQAAIVFGKEAGSFGTEISLPFGGDAGLWERYAPIARTFIESLINKIGRT